MKKGDILFFEPRSLLSKLIAWVDGCPFSHVGVYWGTKDGVPLFIDSDWDGVKVRMLRKDWRNYAVVQLERPFEDVHEIVIENYGKPYDYTHLFYMFLRKVSFGKYIPPQTNPEKFICSELVNYMYGFLPYGTATPANLWEFINDNMVPTQNASVLRIKKK